jgi:hypothetical protein
MKQQTHKTNWRCIRRETIFHPAEDDIVSAAAFVKHMFLSEFMRNASLLYASKIISEQTSKQQLLEQQQ